MFTTHILASGLEDVEYSKYTIEQLGELLLAEFKSIEARGGFKRMVKRIDDEISKHGYAADHSGYGVWKKVNGHYVYEQLRTRKTHMASWEEVWLHLEIFPRETDHFSLVGYIKPNGSYSIVAFDPLRKFYIDGQEITKGGFEEVQSHKKREELESLIAQEEEKIGVLQNVA